MYNRKQKGNAKLSGLHPNFVVCILEFVRLLHRLVFLCIIPVISGQTAERFTFEDWLIVPVRVHLLSSSNAAAFNTTLTETDLDRILKKMNGIWSQAGISFWLESLVREEALPCLSELGDQDELHRLLELRPQTSKGSNLLHLYYVKRLPVNGVYLGEAMFVKDTASLRSVTGGIDEPIPRVSSHEIGHAFTLQHCTNQHHLMFRGTTGTNFDEVEIRQARAAAEKFSWIRRASTIAERAAGGTSAANTRRFEAQLAVIPLDVEPVRRARERLRVGAAGN